MPAKGVESNAYHALASSGWGGPVLGLLLLLATVLGLGCYYETNDDGLLTLLLRGQAAAEPVADLGLYFHGWARLWAVLYRHWPALPWYGLTLYALLAGASALLLAVLERAARPRLTAGPRALLLAGFYFLALLEGVIWFNYSRVPLLLAGGGLLFALQRAADPAPVRHRALLLGLGAVLLAGLIRPSMALLGLLGAGPALWLVAGPAGPAPADPRPAGGGGAAAAGYRVLVWFAAGALAGALVLGWPGPDSALRARRQLDSLLVELNDYGLRRRLPATPADALAADGIRRWWLVGDSAVFNPALFARSIPRHGAAYFAAQVLPGKLLRTVGALGRNYFPLLLALLALLALVASPPRRWAGEPPGGPPGWRRLRWLHLVGGLGLLLALGGVLKLPPRLAQPLLALLVLGQLAYALRYMAAPPRRLRRGLLVLGVGVLGLYAAKTGHRVWLLRREQQVHGAFLHRLQAQAGPRLVVAAGLEPAFKSLSPFRHYGPARVLLLTGWPSLDASQRPFRQQLSGQSQASAAAQRLATDPAVYWLMAPAFVPFYNRYLARVVRLPGPGLRFERLPGPDLLGAAADTALPVRVRPVAAEPGR